MNAKYPLRISSKIMISEYIMTTTIIFYKQRFINMPKNSNTANTRKLCIISCPKTKQKKKGMINNKTEMA